MLVTLVVLGALIVGALFLGLVFVGREITRAEQMRTDGKRLVELMEQEQVARENEERVRHLWEQLEQDAAHLRQIRQRVERFGVFRDERKTS